MLVAGSTEWASAYKILMHHARMSRRQRRRAFERCGGPKAQALTDRLAALAILVESDHLRGEGLALDKFVRAGAVGTSSVPAWFDAL